MAERWQQHSFFGGDTDVPTKRRRQQPPDNQLREAIEQYIDIPTLRRLIAEKGNIQEALRTGDIPTEVSHLLGLLEVMISPIGRDQIRSPHDVAAYLQVKYGHESQECFSVVCLNTKNRVQTVETLYRGTLNSAPVRIAEVLAVPLKYHSAAFITAHNHPSGFPDPSPEDVLLIREINAGARVMDLDHLDHIIFSNDRHISTRERGLGGFDK